MTKISYAQNFEDIMLWRALKNIKNGFYVDVGANDPVLDSVTNLFYLQGWTGINVEPLKKHIFALTNERQRDINLHCAVSDINADLEIWECDVRGWATLDKKVAEIHENNGFQGKWTKTPVKRLDSLLLEHLPELQKDIHFLKVDVEGFEENVIKSNNWEKFRPWIVIIESTIPNSQLESFSSWEQILFSNQYKFIYFDGLNRFYLSEEHYDELAHAFSLPPNIFDDFIKYQDEINRKEISALKVKNENLESEIFDNEKTISELTKDNDELKNNLISLNKELCSVYESRSWKLMAPFRKFASFFKRD